jgi:fructosamine-3-kinase
VALYEFVALVPDLEGTAVVGVDGRLPLVRLEAETRSVVRALAAFEREHGVRAPFLRLGKLLKEGPQQLGLLEFDAASRNDHEQWLPLEAVPDAAPEAFADAVGNWIGEQRGVTRPTLRAPWARPGWRAEAEAWIRSSLDPLGLEVSEIAVARQWPLSSVLRVDTAGGTVYFKAAFAPFRHEPGVTQALARELPALVPEVLATDRERGWMLVRALSGESVDRAAWPEAFSTLARIHATWSGREEEILALGAQDRRLGRLERELANAVDDASAVERLRGRSSALAGLAIPHTLVHGDFHPWNAAGERDHVVIYDWSDACLAHPLFDFATFTQFADDDVWPELVEAYISARPDLEEQTLRKALPLAYPLACVHHSISYARIEEVLEPGERDLFGDAPRRWIERALAAL